ncbi:hypothetical protein SeLEV6574_g05684 [Synchytrium endobioticum]|uniref:Major facilitator superfamily (MFS) profile domain-containing protein n=1 Tax=Synchytrium endobioticum TaxID=286115 RepID=A0A507CSZ6_9FUNG|nr:hypothetical protein SeLEV6574_g05684 [Synchytrium endobioticum]
MKSPFVHSKIHADEPVAAMEMSDGFKPDEKVSDWDAHEEKQLLRKLDYRMMPLCIGLYAFGVVSQINVTNARAFDLSPQTGLGTMELELGMKPNDINNVFSFYFLPYCLLEPFSNFFLIRFRPSVWLSRILLSFGIIGVAMSAISDYHGLLATNIVMGICEAGFVSGISFGLTYWYTPAEVTMRLAAMMVSSSLVTAAVSAFAGLIYYMDQFGNTSAWRWLFFLTGLPPVILAVLLPYLYADEPESATFLNERERHIAVMRLRLSDPAKSKGKKLSWDDTKTALLTWEIWAHAAISFLCFLPLFCVKFFVPSLLAYQGYTGASIQYMSIPPTLLFPVPLIIGVYVADRIKDRTLVYFVSAAAGALTFLGLAWSTNPVISYMLLLMYTVSAPTGALNFGWATVNQRTHTTRGWTLGLMNGISNAGGIIGAQLFRAEQAPRYIQGFVSLSVGFLLSMVLVVLVRVSYKMKNRTLEKKETAKLTMGIPLTDEDKFRYTF